MDAVDASGTATGPAHGSDGWAALSRLVGLPAGADAATLAAALKRAVGDPALEPAVAEGVRGLVEDPPHGREADASAVVVALGARVLAPLMRRYAEDVYARRRILLGAGRGLSADAAARLVLAASVAWDRPCSRAFMELLAKLARAATAGDRGSALAIRELTRLVADRWAEIAAEASSITYEDMVAAEQMTVHHPQSFPEAERLVELAAELDTLTGETWRCVGEMVDRNQTPELLAILHRAPRDSAAAQGIVQHVATPARLKALLEEQPVNFDAVDQLTRALGMAAAEILLDRLSLAQTREERHPFVGRLSSLGPAVAPMAIDRLEDPRWYVQANMLALLRSWKHAPAEVSLARHGAHPDARVRREALQLLLEADPERRDEAIVLGLRDHDPQNVHIVLQAARGACPPQAVNALSSLIGAPTTPAFLRMPAIRLLADIGSGAALEALLRLVDGGTGLLGRKKLAAKSPEMLAALSALRAYRGDKRAADLLAAAEASRDDDMRAAAAGKGVVP